MTTITPHIAIQATLNGDWENAIIYNTQLIEENPTDIGSMNRLAFAYTVLGKIKEAREAYEAVLKIDKTNPIAMKNIKRLGDVSRRNNVTPFAMQHDTFLEEVGKTKMVTLLNPAPANIIRTLQIGQAVELAVKRSKIFAITENEQFVGMLPDDISRRLIKFIDGGNTYVAHMRSVDEKAPCIFIRETKRTAKFKNQPSFIDVEKPLPFTIHKSRLPDDDEPSVEE